MGGGGGAGFLRNDVEQVDVMEPGAPSFNDAISRGGGSVCYCRYFRIMIVFFHHLIIFCTPALSGLNDCSSISCGRNVTPFIS